MLVALVFILREIPGVTCSLHLATVLPAWLHNLVVLVAYELAYLLQGMCLSLLPAGICSQRISGAWGSATLPRCSICADFFGEEFEKALDIVLALQQSQSSFTASCQTHLVI